MVPDKFNMVDMDEIDVIESQGVTIDGLYNKLAAAKNSCRYVILYNWLFDGIPIPPSYVDISLEENMVVINDTIYVTNDDVLHIYSIEPPPIEPTITSLACYENGTYRVGEGVDGFNPVEVDVQPTLESLSVTQNGTYEPSSGYDGFDEVIVNVPSTTPKYEEVESDFYGLATAYISIYGDFYNWRQKNQCLFLASIESGYRYVVFLPEFVGNRFRVTTWAGKTIDDFSQYLDNPAENVIVYSGGTVITPSSDLSGDGLTRRFFFNGVDGEITIHTSSNGQLVEPILLKINS